MALKNHLELKQLENIYCSRDNYKIVDRETPKGVYAKKCYVFFSSHSIYYPNSDEVFEEVIVRNDRFEWVNYVPLDYSRAIFLRDLKKQWYFTGINSNINSFESLKLWLSAQVNGYDEVIFVGSSAGGYASTLFGAALGVDRVFNFAGQFFLRDFIKSALDRELNPILVKYSESESRKHLYDISDYLKLCSSKIYYFFPRHSEDDVFQFRKIRDAKNGIEVFSFNSACHGIPFPIYSLPDLISKSKYDLEKLVAMYKGRSINGFLFSIKISGFGKFVRFAILKIISRFFKSAKRKSFNY